jgi:hypothetical protein
MSFIVIIYEGNYPDGPGSSCTLLGSYLSRKAGRFISETYKRRNKLEFYPRILEADVPPDLPEAEILEANLRLQELRENNDKKHKTTDNKAEKIRGNDSKPL